MGEKTSDLEAPSLSHHESSISIEKQGGDAATAREWAQDVNKSTTINTKLKNPLAVLTREQLLNDVEAFAKEKDLEHILDDLRKGALVAQDPREFEQMDELTESEKELLRREKTHRWSQPFMMYFMTSKSPRDPPGGFCFDPACQSSVLDLLSCREWIRLPSTVHKSTYFPFLYELC
jgi:hypothetical protein